MKNYFELNDELTKFDAQEAVNFFKDLLCKEAIRIGIPTTSVNCPSCIYVADGGIDARIETLKDKISDLFVSEKVRFQIKADSKNPWNESTIVGELFKEKCTLTKFKKFTTKTEKKNHLKPAVKKSLEDKAVYVYLAFKYAFVEKDLNATEALLKKYFSECGYTDTEVKVWGYPQLNQFIEKNFPAILLNIKTERNNLRDLLYDRFSQIDDYTNDYYPDESREEIIKNVRILLQAPNKPREAMHIRVLGASGIGKTKTVLEALNIEELKNNCLIFDSAERFINEAFTGYFDGDEFVILVIDECDKNLADKIFKQIKINLPYIKLITIYNSHDEDYRENCFVVKGLEENILISILKQNFSSYLSDHNINQIVNLCEGFPRVAIKVAENLRDYPDNPEKYLNELDSFWCQYISDKNSFSSEETKAKIRILEYLSLFERFGYKGSNIEEFNFIKSKIRENNSISNDDIDLYVNELKQKSILRGESVLYISPRIFHNWLKKQWHKHKTDFDYDNFTAGMPQSLLNEFNKEIVDLDSEIKKKIINSKFNNLDDFENQSVLFGSLIYKCEDEAFDRLESIVDATPETDLENPRQNIKNYLMYFAKYEKYFERSCDLLFRIACFEGKTWYSNNTQVSFTELFDIFYNHKEMASTFTPLEKKALYLKGLLNNNLTEKELEIILNAIAEGVRNPRDISKSKSDNKSVTYFRLTEQIVFTTIEYNYISSLLELTIKVLEQTNVGELVKKCNNILVNKPFYLLQDDKTFDFAITHYEKLNHNVKIDKLELIKQFENALKYKRFKALNNENINKINILYKSFKKEINFDDFKVFCMNNYYLEKEQEPKLKEFLAAGSLNEGDNLDFLFTKESKLSYKVGSEIALIDDNWSYFNKIVSKYEELGDPPNTEIISGYFRGAYKLNPVETENKILEIDENSPLFKILPIIVCTVATDAPVRFLFEYIKNNKFNISDFRISLNECSKDLLVEILEYLLSKSDDKQSIDLVMGILNFSRKRIDYPQALVLQCLDKSIDYTFSKSHTDSYVWNAIALQYINSDSPKELLLNMFKKIIEIKNDFHDEYTKSSLCHIAKTHPKETWERFSTILEKPDGYKFYISGHELWQNNGLLSIFEHDWILEWIDEKIDPRLYIIANLAPDKFLPDENNEDSKFYRNLLIKYPNIKELSDTLVGRSFSGFYEGKESDNTKSKIKKIEKLLENETEKAIKKWLKQELDYTEKRLKDSLEREERFEY